MHISPKIRLRAEQILADKGAISNLRAISEGYSATVAGSEDYTVTIQVSASNAEKVIASFCSCPYDYEGPCKHIAAVWLAIENGAAIEDAKDALRDLEKMLSKHTKKELIKRLVSLAEADDDMHDRIVTTFELAKSGHNRIEKVAANVRKAVEKIIHGRRDFHPYHASKEVYQILQTPLRQLEDYLREENYAAGLVLAKALAETCTYAYGYVDDSNGYVSEISYPAIQALYTISDRPALDETLRKELLQYCINTVSEKTHEDWDYHTDLMEIGSGLVRNEYEMQKMVTAMNKSQGNYTKSAAVLLESDMLKRLGLEEQAGEKLLANVSDPRVRLKAIEAAFAKTDYKTVCKLAEDGLAARDERGRAVAPGYHKHFNKALLDVARVKGDEKLVRKYLRQAYLNADDRDIVTLAALKEVYSANEWPQEVDKLLVELAGLESWSSESRIDTLLDFAGRHDELFKRIIANPSINRLRANATRLPAKFHLQLALTYEGPLRQMLSERANKQSYEQAASLLKAIADLGDRSFAEELSAELKEQYNRRTTMIRIFEARGF